MHRRPHTPESRAKIAAGMRGKRNRLGSQQSDEAKARISLAMRRYHALKKAGLLETTDGD